MSDSLDKIDELAQARLYTTMEQIYRANQKLREATTKAPTVSVHLAANGGIAACGHQLEQDDTLVRVGTHMYCVRCAFEKVKE